MGTETLAGRLARWGYLHSINNRVRPILELAEQGELRKFEEAICVFTSKILKQVARHELSAQEADSLFMVLDLYVTEKDLREQLSPDVQELIFEGLLFHHFRERHGPDLARMRDLLKKRMEIRTGYRGDT